MPDLFDHNEDERRLTRQTMSRLLDTVSLVGQLFTEPPLEGVATPGGTILRLAEAIPGVEVLELTGSGANSWGLQDAYIRKLLPTYAWTADSGSPNVACPPANRQVWAVDANLLPLPTLPDPIPTNTSGLNTSFPGGGATGRVLGLRLGNFAGRDTYAIVPSTGGVMPAIETSYVLALGTGSGQAIPSMASTVVTNFYAAATTAKYSGSVQAPLAWDSPTGTIKTGAGGLCLVGFSGYFSGIASTTVNMLARIDRSSSSNPGFYQQSTKAVPTSEQGNITVVGLFTLGANETVRALVFQDSGTSMTWISQAFWAVRFPFF